jgi:hypothetical protein
MDGIDVTYLAIDLIRNRLRGLYGDAIEATYVVDGIPADEDSARALFAASPFDFERWAVSLVDGTPNEKQVGDKGIDGVVRFPLDGRGGVGRALVSVKGGKTLNPGMVRDLIGTVRVSACRNGAAHHAGTGYQGHGGCSPALGNLHLAGQPPAIPAGATPDRRRPRSAGNARGCRHRSCPTSKPSASLPRPSN